MCVGLVRLLGIFLGHTTDTVIECCILYDVWCMMYDICCMMYDVWLLLCWMLGVYNASYMSTGIRAIRAQPDVRGGAYGSCVLCLVLGIDSTYVKCLIWYDLIWFDVVCCMCFLHFLFFIHLFYIHLFTSFHFITLPRPVPSHFISLSYPPHTHTHTHSH
jgi:hypothetical protein